VWRLVAVHTVTNRQWHQEAVRELAALDKGA
jgi:hypothetical protein